MATTTLSVFGVPRDGQAAIGAKDEAAPEAPSDMGRRRRFVGGVMGFLLFLLGAA